MDYLGLSDDDGYGDYDPYEDQATPARRPAQAPVAAPDPVLVHPRVSSSVIAVPSAPVEGPGGGVVGLTVQAFEKV